MAILTATVRFWAFVAGAHLLLALWLIGSGQWGSVVHIAWLTPDASLVTWRFLYFSVVSMTFVFAGITVGADASKGMKVCSAGFIMGLLGFTWFAQAEVTSRDAATSLIFFVMPALLYAAGAYWPQKGQSLKRTSG